MKYLFSFTSIEEGVCKKELSEAVIKEGRVGTR